MKWEKFDKKVNKELAEHQAEVDIDALWGAIEPEVDAINAEKKKRRRGGVLWFFGAFLLIGITVGMLFFSRDSNQRVTELNQETAIVKISETSNAKENLNIEKAKINDKEVLLSEKSVENRNEDEDSLGKFETREGKGISKTENTDKNAAETKVENANISQSADIPENQKKNSSIKLNGNNQLKTNLTQNHRETPVEIAIVSNEKTTGLPENNVVDFEEITAETIIKNTEIAESKPAILNKENKNTLLSLPANTVKEIVYPIADLSRKILTDEEVKAIKKAISSATEEDEDAKNNGKKTFNLAMSAYGGAGFANRNLQAKADNLPSDLQQLRGNTESNLETVQLGLQLHLQHEKTGLKFLTGLNYTQINERFNYNTAVVEMDSVQGVEFVYRNVNGDTIQTLGMLPRTTATTFTNRHYNKYRLLDVPVLVGYQKQLGDKFFIGAQAGVFINLQLKTSGRFLASDTEIVDFEDADVFKSSVGLSYYFGATFGYKLTDKWSITAAPFVRHLPQNFAKSTYGLEQKYTLYGLNLGLQYQF